MSGIFKNCFLPVCAAFACAVVFSCASQSGAASDEQPFAFEASALAVSEFSEVWGYLISGQEAALLPGLPLTDIGYFGAEVDSYGNLASVPRREVLAFFAGRVHLVVTCPGYGLTHFMLDPASPGRSALVSQLVKAAAAYDGLQIDFENVLARDGDLFLSFLQQLRAELPKGKMLTVALPARERVYANDRYDYAAIAPVVDRLLVMAYDEHWSTSAPGPVASMEWCRRVALHAQSQVPPEKLVMLAPFYGRTWGSENTFRAFFHSGIERIKNENDVQEINRENGIPYFSYEIPVTVNVYYEDAVSLTTRLSMYSAMRITRTGFWRLGQEDPQIWQFIKLAN